MAIWIGVLTLILTAALGGLWYTGVPQRRVLEALVGSQLNAHVEVGKVSLKNPIAIQGLVLSDAAQSIYTPLLRIDHIGARYRWKPDAPRHVESLTLDGVRLAVHGGGDHGNFKFLEALFTPSTEGGTTSPDAWIPEQFQLTDFWFETRFPGYYLRLDQVGATGKLDGLSAGTLSIQAPELGLAWESILTPGGAQSYVGALGLTGTWSETSMGLDAKLDFGRLAQLDGKARVERNETGQIIDVTIATARLDDPLWSAILMEHLPTPVRFENLSLSDVHIGLHNDANGYRIDAAEFDGAIASLTIGPEETPYYKGPLEVAVHGSYGETTTIAADMKVTDGLALTAAATLSDETTTATLEMPPWPVETIKVLIPEAYRSYLDIVAPLKTLGIAAELSHVGTTYSVTGTLSPAFADKTALEMPLSLQVESADGVQQVTASTAIALGEEKVVTEISGDPAQTLTLINALHDVTPGRWTKTLLGLVILPDLKGAFTGDVEVTVIPDTPVGIDVDLRGREFGYGDIVVSGETPTTLQGALRYDLLTGGIRGNTFDLKGAALGDLVLKSWTMNTSTTAFNSAFDTTLQMGALMGQFELSDPYGVVEMTGDFSYAQDRIQMGSVTARSKDFGYGDWSVPYGSTLTLAGDVDYDLAKSAMVFAPIEARLDDGTQITATDFAMNFPTETTGFQLHATGLTVHSDLAVLVQLGFLDTVEGGESVIISPNLAWTESEFSAPTTWSASAARLKLTDDMAELENLVTRGEFTVASGTSGSGPLSADSLLIYGMPFGAIDTTLDIDSTHIACRDLETTFLEGDLVVSARLEYLDAALPVAADLKVTGLNLAEFTKAFEPPDIVLTGIVNGTISVELTMEGLTRLDVDLESDEGLSLNRSMVRQILMSQYVNDAVGSKRIQKIMEKVVGEVEQRPFKKATLDLGLKDGFIDGVARLESDTLDVTVDINADPAALLEAIRSSTLKSP